jgi:predicted nuclease of predicted toxin-antitoxin system
MSLRFFSDQCIPDEITAILREHGHHVTLLREVLPIRSPDPAVIAKAQELGAILISLNGDFADIVSYPPAHFAGIVSIQLHNHPEIIPQLMEAFLNFLAAHPPQEFFHGKLLLVEVHRVRIRQ